MTRRLITLEVDGPIVVLRGWKAHGLALGAGLRPTYSGVRSGWIADTRRLPDLVGYLQHRNIPVDVIDLNATADVAAQETSDPEPAIPVAADVQLDLFGGAVA